MPDFHAGWWLCFTLDHDEAAAAARFLERFGQPPANILEQDGLLWLGPLP